MTLSTNIKEAFERVGSEIASLSGGSALVFGQVIASMIPISRTGLVLLDGSVLRGDGAYASAVSTIAALQESSSDIFLTEDEWQSQYGTYGSCNKFVVGDDDGVTTLRLPCLHDSWHRQKFYMVVSDAGVGEVELDTANILTAITRLESLINALQTRVDNMESRCTVEWFAVSEPPVGYLLCDGAAVSRETYATLFAKIGVTFGEGDGSTTFNLPDLIGRFAEGSATPGTVEEAGLPNITGTLYDAGNAGAGPGYYNYRTGAFYAFTPAYQQAWATVTKYDNYDPCFTIGLDASRSSSIYGNSTTVQPPALTLLPCIWTGVTGVTGGG